MDTLSTEWLHTDRKYSQESRVYLLGVLRSLAVLFLRSGYSGTWTCSTWDTRFWALPEGRAERRDTGDMSDLVERRSLRLLDTGGRRAARECL